MLISLQQNTVRWGVWWLVLLVWTGCLLSTQAPVAVAAVVPSDYTFYVAKFAHVSCYALLSALVGILPVSPRQQAYLRLFLIGHGVLTEYLQTFVPGRTGTVRDAVIDAVGVMLGWGAWSSWRRLQRA